MTKVQGPPEHFKLGIDSLGRDPIDWDQWSWYCNEWGHIGTWIRIAVLAGIATGYVDGFTDEDVALARDQFEGPDVAKHLDVDCIVEEQGDFPVASGTFGNFEILSGPGSR